MKYIKKQVPDLEPVFFKSVLFPLPAKISCGESGRRLFYGLGVVLYTWKLNTNVRFLME